MRIIYLSISLIVIDQISKLFVKGFKIPFLGIDITGMQYGESIPVIGDFFKLTFVENPGMAFGIDFGDTVKLWISVFSIVASIGLVFYLYYIRNQGFTFRLSIALILAGAVGNAIDRVFYGLFYGYSPIFFGKVVDFFDLDFFNFEILGRTYDRWPIFNVADMAVSAGVIVLILFYNKHEKKAETVSADSSPVSEIEVNETDSPVSDGQDIKLAEIKE